MATKLQILAACLLCFFMLVTAVRAKEPALAAGAAAQRLSGPYTQDNLTIYLIHGPSVLKGDYVTLPEAMADKKVVVHETGNVNELAVENLSDEPVYVQSGDIVKGGRQDRTIAIDLVLPPKSGKVPVASFCVEHGRWSRRGGEAATQFSGSSATVAGLKMKLASNSGYGSGGGQSKVWDEVQANQSKLSSSLGKSVAATTSPSSYQLTLENKDVQAAVERYVAKLKDAPGEKDDVVGYAMAINGKVNCADVYGSSDLFRKLWPRLLRSAAVEAAGEAKGNKTVAAPSADAVLATMRDAEDGKRTEKQAGERVTVTACESEKNVMIESRDKAAAPAAAASDAYLHRSYLSKE